MDFDCPLWAVLSETVFVWVIWKKLERKTIEKRSTITSRCLESRPPRIKGSSSDVFLDQLHPSIGLNLRWKKNRYQHPHKELLDRLEERSISYLRTDERGAIRLIGWDHWRVETVR